MLCSRVFLTALEGIRVQPAAKDADVSQTVCKLSLDQTQGTSGDKQIGSGRRRRPPGTRKIRITGSMRRQMGPTVGILVQLPITDSLVL